MKKITLVFAFMLAVAGATAQSMYVHKTDGNVYEFKVSDVDSINFAASTTTDDYFYTITYMPNGVEADIIVDTVRYGMSYTFREETTFSTDDSILLKWSTEANGSGAVFAFGETISLTRNITLYAVWVVCRGMENGYEWVDLGLPSGLKWATCNVGASKPEDSGSFFAWGETTPKTTYSWSTYKFMDSNINNWNGVTKYTFADGQNEYDGIKVAWYDSEGNFIGDNKTILDPEDDAATVNMGGSWRMPTKTEMQELDEFCTVKYENDCLKLTSKTNGAYIYMPIYINETGAWDYRAGYIWSSSLGSTYSDAAIYGGSYSYESFETYESGARYNGYGVRGVCE